VVIGAAAEIGVFAVALWWQFRTRRYYAPAYWSLAFAIAIFGTGVSDTLHLVLGIPYAGTTLLWAIVLGAVFCQWNRRRAPCRSTALLPAAVRATTGALPPQSRHLLSSPTHES
jgi:uncharacterized membrane-anchored protein